MNQGLTEAGLLIKQEQVSIIDASVIEAKQSRPHKCADGENTQDKEAGYNVKQSGDGKMKTTFGFKAHVNVDEDGLISQVITTAGNIHDSQCLEDLLTEAVTALYADSAYASQAHDQLLKEKQIKNGLLKREYRNRPHTRTEKLHNKRLSSIRSTVERVFDILKQQYGMGKALYLGKQRNHARLM